MDTIRTNIENRIIPILDKAGMYYRIFSRVKSTSSIQRNSSQCRNINLEFPFSRYMRCQFRVQGMNTFQNQNRIIFYFQEDVNIFYEKLKCMEGYDKNNESNSLEELKELSDIIEGLDGKDSNQGMLKKLLPFHDKIFMPQRLNIVMNMNEQEKNAFQFLLPTLGDYADLIDSTYEIQLRTVLSEGWHEIEHDLRYKTKDETWWNFCTEESRMLNGIYAALETNERALSQMIEELTYKNYKNHSWDAMIRFHFCKRMTEDKLSPDICSILDDDDRVAKDILHVTRAEFTEWLWAIPHKISLSTQFALFLINRKKLNNGTILSIEPEPIRMILDKLG